MKHPSHECLLTAELCRIDHTLTKSPGCAPVVATRVCAMAWSYRRLNEKPTHANMNVLVTPTFTTSPVPVLSCWDIEDTIL